MSEEVIELSIDETNALRAKIGLAPLRIDKKKHNSSSEIKDGQDEHVDDEDDKDEGKTSRTAKHAPAENMMDVANAKRRVEEQKLKRQVKEGVDRIKRMAGEDDDESKEKESAMDWASKMRKSTDDAKKSTKSKKKSKSSSANREEEKSSVYTNDELKGLKVSHNASEFETGESTILTLKDESILQKDEHDAKVIGVQDSGNVLENVSKADARRTNANLAKKRLVEMGVGHAGGYVGWDDDEFEELGGSRAVSAASGPKQQQSYSMLNMNEDGGANSSSSGFRIGDNDAMQDQHRNGTSNDLFSSEQAINISSNITKDNVASDFLTRDEIDKEQEEKIRKKRKKEEKKLFKKLKKKEKKDHKKKKRRRQHNSDNDGSDDDDKEKEDATRGGGSSLMDDLEATAVDKSGRSGHRGGRRKRSLEDDDDDDNDNGNDNGVVPMDVTKTEESKSELDLEQERRQKFDQIMQKGNARTKKAFSLQQPSSSTILKKEKEEEEQAEQDDSFLNAALQKARRLKKLKELAAASATSTNTTSNTTTTTADKIVQAMKENNETSQSASHTSGSTTNNNNEEVGITFEFDATREFSLALRDQETEEKKKAAAAITKKRGGGVAFSNSKQKSKHSKNEDNSMETETMEELAKQITNHDDDNDDDDNSEEESGGFGSKANTAPVGRGLSTFFTHLKSTGDISGKHAGKEELRGRAKDERTYEDYEALNLNKVVKIDKSRANPKDLEFANREIKLEYRDEHGRLLTRKEAWRNVCYQFHGYGSSTKNQERRLRQIEREREEGARHNEVANRGTLGALKATQKATGKAFVVHRT